MARSQCSPVSFELIFALCLLGCIGLHGGALADGPPARAGAEFQIDDGPHDLYHDFPKAIMRSDGTFLVVWRSQEPHGDDTSQDSIQAQRYASGGNPLGSIFQVNSYTTSFQDQPDIAMGPDGDAVVVWRGLRSPGSDNAFGIVGRRLSALGFPVGEDFQINTVTTGTQEIPTVDVAPSGDFVVLWQSDSSAGNDTATDSIQGRRYDADGTPFGDQFQVNDHTPGSQREPDLSFAPDGSFVVVWASYGSPGSDDSSSSVQGQRFDSIGQALGQQFQVNSYTSGTQRRPAVDHRDDGSFLIVWEGNGGAPTSTIQGQRYDDAGLPVDGEQVISAATTHGEWPSVAVNANGEYVVAWAGGYAGTFNEGVSGQIMSPSGVLLEERFVIDTSSYWAYQTDVAAGDQGDFVVVWYSQMYPQSGGSYLLVNSTHGQRFSSPFFADGFETGDTSSWSETVP